MNNFILRIHLNLFAFTDLKYFFNKYFVICNIYNTISELLIIQIFKIISYLISSFSKKKMNLGRNELLNWIN